MSLLYRFQQYAKLLQSNFACIARDCTLLASASSPRQTSSQDSRTAQAATAVLTSTAQRFVAPKQRKYWLPCLGRNPAIVHSRHVWHLLPQRCRPQQLLFPECRGGCLLNPPQSTPLVELSLPLPLHRYITPLKEMLEPHFWCYKGPSYLLEHRSWLERRSGFLNLNARGARLQLLELQKFLSEHDVDVYCIIETFLSPTKEIFIPGFITYLHDQTTGGSGRSAILVSSTISHAEPKLHHRPNAVSMDFKHPKGSLQMIACYSSLRYVLYEHKIDSASPPNPHVPTTVAGELSAKHIV